MTTSVGDTSQRERATARRLKIGEVSRLSGVGVDALRFYERRGIVGRPVRTESGYRLYDAAVLDQLEFVKRAQALGFSLDEIARITAEKAAGQSPCAEVREIVRARLRELDARLAELQRYRGELEAALREWDEIGEADGHVCGLIESTEVDRPAHADGVSKRRRS